MREVADGDVVRRSRQCAPFVDLPAKAYEMALRNFKAMKKGTAFGGEPDVGVKVEELLEREGKL